MYRNILGSCQNNVYPEAELYLEKFNFGQFDTFMYLCADNVISTGHRISNVCFDFFSVDIKIKSERSTIHSKLSLLS